MTFQAHTLQLILLTITLASSLATRTIQAQERLRDFTPKNFMIGGRLHAYPGIESFQSEEYRNVALHEFNAVTASAYLTWGGWENPRRVPNTSGFDVVVDWARQNSLKVHGHALWYPAANQQSDWWQSLPNSEVGKHMARFIATFAQTRSGKVDVWDVVNEVMADNGQPMDGIGLRSQYKEYKALGPSYVDFAFQLARDADPNATLILNDTGIVTVNDKSTRLLNYAKRLKATGVPIDGIGFQAHFVDTRSPAPDVASMTRNFRRFAAAGFKLFITEFDVCAIQTRDPSPNRPGFSTPNDQQHARQKRYFEEVLRLALNEPACHGFFLWDYADDFSWLHKSEQQIGSLPAGVYTYPTPFWCGKHCPITRKPAFDGLLNALKSTPRISR